MISQIINVAMAMPSLPLTIILVVFLNAGLGNLIIAICITAYGTARIIRAARSSCASFPSCAWRR